MSGVADRDAECEAMEREIQSLQDKLSDLVKTMEDIRTCLRGAIPRIRQCADVHPHKAARVLLRVWASNLEGYLPERLGEELPLPGVVLSPVGCDGCLKPLYE